MSYQTIDRMTKRSGDECLVCLRAGVLPAWLVYKLGDNGVGDAQLTDSRELMFYQTVDRRRYPEEMYG